MHAVVFPAARLRMGEHGVEHHLGAADVETIAGRYVVQQRLDVQRRTGLGIGMHTQIVTQQRLQLGQEGHQVAAAPGVVHSNFGTLRAAARGHGRERCHADAAGHQNRTTRTGVQRKVIFRRLDREHVAFFQLLVHEARAATAFGLLAHGDDVLRRRHGGVAFDREVDERVVAPVGLAVGQRHLHADVRTGSESGQGTAVVAPQTQQPDQRIESVCFGNAKLEGGDRSSHKVFLQPSACRISAACSLWPCSSASAASRSSRKVAGASCAPARSTERIKVS